RFREITRRRMVVRRLRRGACLSGFRVLLHGRRGFEHGGEKLFAGNQRGNEERPGQETERAGSLVRTLHTGFEDLPLLFEQFAFFYVVHDRRVLSSRSTQKQLSPDSTLPGESFRRIRRSCRATCPSARPNALRRSDPPGPSVRWRI